MAFDIPNAADAAVPAQAELDSVDLDILTAAIAGTGVVSGCAVTAQGTPDMTLAVASGSVKVAGSTASVSAGNVTITAAHATLNRFDLVVVNSSGTKSVTAGTPAADPVFPAIPANSVVLAAVWVPAADTAIQSAQIVDKRTAPASTAAGGSGDGLVTFAVVGNLAVVTGAARWYADKNYTVSKVRASVGTQPTGASVIVDVNKNGTTIFTTQANRPTIAASTNTDEANNPDVTALAAGDYLTVDVDQIGSTVAGADLTVQLVLTPA